jgi:hypothetical protein
MWYAFVALSANKAANLDFNLANDSCFIVLQKLFHETTLILDHERILILVQENSIYATTS